MKLLGGHRCSGYCTEQKGVTSYYNGNDKNGNKNITEYYSKVKIDINSEKNILWNEGYMFFSSIKESS